MDLPPTAAPDAWTRIPRGGAVCALADNDDRVVQLLATQALRRMLQTRLDPQRQPQRSRRADLRSVVARIWWQPTGSHFETDWVYLNIARQLWPGDYREKLAFVPVWFARIDLAERFPRWTAASEGFAPQVAAAGPFATRRQAGRFIHYLEEIFDLCRYHHILVQYPHGQPCAYLDMGKCPAPCNGSIDLHRYRHMLDASAAFAAGDGGALRASVESSMAAASANLHFEHAQRLKVTLQQIEKAESIKGRLASSPEALNYLIVQPGTEPSSVRPFFARRGCIEPGRQVRLDDLAAALGSWTTIMSSDKALKCDASYRAECVWLLGRYLGKRGKLPGAWIEHPDFTDERAILRRVRECFCKVRPQRHGKC